MHSKGIAQNPLSRKMRIWIALLVAILGAGFFWVFIDGGKTEDLFQPRKKMATWTQVHIPMDATFTTTLNGCVKERVQQHFPWGDTWKEFIDCPGKNIALGKIGPNLFFQSTTNKPVEVSIKYSVSGGRIQIQKIIAPPGK